MRATLNRVGGQALDAGVHGLALGRLADLVVGRGQIGKRPPASEGGDRVAGGAGLGHGRSM